MSLSSLLSSFSSGAAIQSPVSNVVANIHSTISNLSATSVAGTVISMSDYDGAHFTGSINGNTLTVSSNGFSGYLRIGHLITSTVAGKAEILYANGNAILGNTYVTSQINGNSGQDGNYQVSSVDANGNPQSQTVISSGMYALINPDELDQIGTAIDSINTQMAAYAQKAVKDMPLVNASEKLQIQKKVSDGITPSAAPSESFKNIHAPLIEIPALLGNLYASLTTIQGNAVAPCDGLIPLTANVVADVGASHASASTAFGLSMAELGTYATVAFAMAGSGGSLPAIGAMLGSMLAVPATAADKAEIAADQAAASKVINTTLSAEPPTSTNVSPGVVGPAPTAPAADIPKPVGSVCEYASEEEFKTAYKKYFYKLDKVRKANLDKVNVAAKALTAWSLAKWPNPTLTQMADDANGWFASDEKKAKAKAANDEYENSAEYNAWADVELNNRAFDTALTGLVSAMKEWKAAEGGLSANATCGEENWLIYAMVQSGLQTQTLARYVKRINAALAAAGEAPSIPGIPGTPAIAAIPAVPAVPAPIPAPVPPTIAPTPPASVVTSPVMKCKNPDGSAMTHQQFLDAYQANIDNLWAAYSAYSKNTINPASAALDQYVATAWQHPTYNQIMNAWQGSIPASSAKDDARIAAGKAALDTYHASPQYVALHNALDTQEKALRNIRRLEAQIDKWRNAPGGLEANAICNKESW